jgi:hypothetical protein
MTSVYQMDCSHQNDELDTRPERLVQSAVNFMQSQNVQFEISTCKTPDCSFEEPPSQEVKNTVWDYSKLADPTYSDLIADIQETTASAAAEAASGPSTTSRSCT